MFFNYCENFSLCMVRDIMEYNYHLGQAKIIKAYFSAKVKLLKKCIKYNFLILSFKFKKFKKNIKSYFMVKGVKGIY